MTIWMQNTSKQFCNKILEIQDFPESKTYFVRIVQCRCQIRIRGLTPAVLLNTETDP